MPTAIRVQGVSKKYQLGLTHARSLNEVAAQWTRRLRGLPPVVPALEAPGGRAAAGEFLALDDVSFEVQPGEVVGIIGRNGAGKSTLLKILSRIAKPTAGRVEIGGRVGSLLEVGTGFHPELTGRENVYLNGTLLGMTKREVTRRFDEIVDFAGVDRFVDTPVKRYSSGMKVRLGFAVAAHLEPDILIVDEVLAVGDARFQRKCLGKMQDVAAGGRTVLFVSHNIGVVRSVCRRGIWIESGRVKLDAAISDTTDAYLRVDGAQASENEWVRTAPDGDADFELLRVAVEDARGSRRSTFSNDDPLLVNIDYVVRSALPPSRVGFVLYDAEANAVFESYDADCVEQHEGREPGVYRSSGRIPAHLLNAGLFRLTVHATIPYVRVLQHVENVVSFSIDESRVGQPWAHFRRRGPVRPAVAWTTASRPELTGSG